MSNFDRYERELKEGKLKWGFIHSSKFWSENVLKFEQNDFRPLKMLAMLLTSQDCVADTCCRTRPRFGRHRPKLAGSTRNHRPKVVDIAPELARHWPLLAGPKPNLTGPKSTLVKFGLVLAGPICQFGPVRTNFGRIRAEFGRIRADFG